MESRTPDQPIQSMPPIYTEKKQITPMLFILGFCYAFIPISALTYRIFTNEKFPRELIDPIWLLILVGTAVYTAITKPRLQKPSSILLTASILLTLYILTVIFSTLGTEPKTQRNIAAFELKLPLYTAIASLSLALTPNNPRLTIVKLGALLSTIITIDTIHQSIIYQTFSRPQGSGEVNYDALLISIALCVAVGNRKTIPLRYLACLSIGLLLSQSRTMLFSTILAISIYTNISTAKKTLILIAGMIVFGATFEARGLEISVESVDRYWMWVTGIEALSDPAVFLFGNKLGMPLLVDIPEPVYDLWMGQTQYLTIQGVYTYNLHAFWLRFAGNYGAPAAITLAAVILFISHRANNTDGKMASLAIILSGFTMGTFYLTNVATPVLICLAILNQNESTITNNWHRNP